MAGQRSKRRRWLIFGLPLVVILLFLVVAIALLPALISAGLGYDRIRAAMQPHINGSADFAAIRLRWRGPQELTGLHVRDVNGDDSAHLDLTTDYSLIGLIFGGVEQIDLRVTGTLNGTLYEDGTTTFQRLFNVNPNTRGTSPRGTNNVDLAKLPLLRTTLELERITLRDEASGRTVVLRHATGDIHLDPTRRMSLDFESETEADGLPGTITFAAVGNQLFDARGRFAPAQGSLTIELEAGGLPILGLHEPGELERLTLSARSAQLTDRVVIELRADARIEGMEPSRLDGALTVGSLFRDDGTLNFQPENVSGTLTGDRVPSTIIQPFLAATPVVLTRDAGPTVDVNVNLVARDDAESAESAQSEIVAAISAVGSRHNAALEVDATFNLDSNQWRGKRLLLQSSAAHPDLVRGYTGMTIREPTDVRIELTDFTVPPMDESQRKRPLAEYAALGTITVNGPVVVALGEHEDARSIAVESAHLEFASPRLRDRVALNGSANIDGGDVTFNHTVTNFFDAEGELDATAARPVGELAIQNFPIRTLIDLAPDYREILDEALGAAVNAQLVTRVVDGALEGTVTARASGGTATATVRRYPDRLHLSAANAEVTISPKLVALTQDGVARRITALEPIPLSINVEPITLPLTDRWTPNWADASEDPIRLTIRAASAPLDSVPGMAAPINIRDSKIVLAIPPALMRADDRPSANVATAIGASIHRLDGTGTRIARLNADLNIQPADVIEYDGRVALTAIRTRQLELVTGLERESIIKWLGDGGDITADMSGRAMTFDGIITSAMQRLTGQLDLSLDERELLIRTDGASATLRASALEQFINTAGENTVAHLQDDVPVQLRDTTLRVPATVLFGDDAERNAAVGDISLQALLVGGPVRLRDQNQAEVILDDLHMTIDATALRQGVGVKLMGTSSHENGPSGSIAADGTVRNLFDSASRLDYYAAIIDLEAQTKRAPTILLDSLLGMNGYLYAAVGPDMNATVTARNFSFNSGSINVDAETESGFLRGGGTVRDGLLHVPTETPVTAQLDLTPLMRRALLSRLHPILGDLVTTRQPLRATFANATLPITKEKGVASLNGDLEMHLGRADLLGSSQLLSMLDLRKIADFHKLDVPGQFTGDSPVEVAFAPIHATIRNGVIEYDRFQFNLLGQDIALPGRVDLTKKNNTLDLATQLPLFAILNSIVPDRLSDLSRIPFVGGAVHDLMTVPLRITGSPEQPKHEFEWGRIRGNGGDQSPKKRPQDFLDELLKPREP